MRSGAGGAEANGSKICPECAESVKADALVCRYCRYDFSGTAAVQPASSGTASAPTLNALAVASLVLGILWIWFVGSLLALIFGYVSRRQIRRSRGRQRGEGLATAGIVLGWIAMVALAVVVGLGVVEGAAFSFWHHAEVSQRDTAIADVRRLRDAMDAYYAKHHSYPDSSAGPEGSPHLSAA